MDFISFLNEIALALLKHGWSVTTIGIAVTALLRVNGVRKIILKRLPKRFRHEDKLERIERKIDALTAHMGVQEWIASSSEVTTPSSVKKSVMPSISHWAAFITARRAKCSTNLTMRRKKVMSKFKSRKFILAVVSAILIVLNDGLDLGIDSNTVLTFAGMVSVWITGEVVVDFAKAKKVVANEEHYTDTDHSV